MKQLRTCPLCGKEYSDHPALSRKDNQTEICPDCGTMEAMEEAGFTADMKADVMARARKAREEAGV